jgi:membrane fusion protein (multidrug efflux system)
VIVNDAEKPESGTENGAPPNGRSGGAEKFSPAKAVFRVLLIAALVVGAVIGIRYWIWTTGHASTDDAYITTDVVQISPQVSGTVQRVLVEDNQLVKRGQLLVTLDDSTYRSAVEQAKANLDVTIAQAKGAGVSVNLTQQTGSAQIAQAQGGLGQAASGIEGAKAGVAQARAAVASAIANQKRYEAAVSSAQAAVATAKANQAAAKASVNAAQANYDNAAREARRFATLAKEGADSQERAEQMATAATSAKAALDSAHEQVNANQAVVESKQADLEAAREQLRAAASAIDQAKAQLAAAREGVPQAVARHEQAQGTLSQAKTAPAQVAVSQTAKIQAEAKVEQARAALKNAVLQLSYCRIYAPTDGRVSKKNIEVGELVQPGTPLMALIPPLDAWVVANFKETQLKGMTTGHKAEIYVDAIPGQTLTGRVESISAGTGSTFALLPPENATGNFVKIVQRVPVKIALDPKQPHLDRLRAGMSVTAVVEIK